MCEYKNDDKPQVDLQLNLSDCAMLSDFELYSTHIESAKIEKWSIFNTKIDYVQYNRKELPSGTVKCSPTEGKCQNRYRQLQSENQPCQEIA